MRRMTAVTSAIVILFFAVTAAGEDVSGTRDLFARPEITATPAPDAFRFRDGIRWGMNRQQVKALETEPMTERSMQDWAIMLTDGMVTVSRFTADLVFIFREDRLQMISYEFQRNTVDDYYYLTGALTSVYGKAEEAEPLKIKALMDSINPDRYKAEMITRACEWATADGTSVYLYYYSPSAFAITYVSPELGNRIYQTNGL